MLGHMANKMFSSDAARVLKVSTKTVHEMVKDGRLPAERVGRQGSRLFDANDVQRLKEARAKNKGPWKPRS